MSETIVFRLSEKNDFSKINSTKETKNFIADLTNVELSIIDIVKEKFIKFDEIIYNNKGSFVIVSLINFNDDLNIVPSLQEAYDFIEMEEIERQLN